MRQALELISGFTADQWGMVTSQQAKGLGVDDSTLHRMEKAGYLDRVRRGVYASTTAVVTAAREVQAAWLALNPAVAGWARPRVDPDGGVVSHHSATRIYGIGELVNDRITFTTPRRRTSRDPDLRFKRAELPVEDVTLLDGLPVTTAARTICDLLDENLDGSHIGTIIREAVHANLVELDTLASRIGPYALRYNVRRPGDGEALLEHLLDQVGETIEQLARRPAPAHFSSRDAASLLAQLTVSETSALKDFLTPSGVKAASFLLDQRLPLKALAMNLNLSTMKAFQEPVLPGPALFAGLSPDLASLKALTGESSANDAVLALGRKAEAIEGVTAAAAREFGKDVVGDRAATGEDDAHGSTETPGDTQGLSRLAEEAREEHGEGDGRQSR